MPGKAEALREDANLITFKFALYFSLEDKNRHTDAHSVISLITDFSLVAVATEILPIVGHHLVERATDFVLDHVVDGSRTLKKKLLSALRSEPAETAETADETELSLESKQLIEIMTKALSLAGSSEFERSLAAGEVAVETTVRAEFKVPHAKAKDYAVALTREVRLKVSRT